MSKSAAGTADAPGRHVRAKSGLNKSILDQAWFEFRRQLEYKLAWNGGRLVVVPPQNTSRTCPCCGCVSADNRQTQARFVCTESGFEEHADLVGAINILSRGMRMLRDEGRDTAHACAGMVAQGARLSARMACGSNRTSGRKQEPTETTAHGVIHA
jgi:putative transposase